MPLTGGVSYLGEQELLGLEAGIEAYNRARGSAPRIVLRVEDTGGQPARAVTAAHKLLDVDRASLLFVTMSSAFKAMVPVAEAARVPTLVMASEPDLLQGHPLSYRVYMNFGDEAATLADHINRRPQPSIAILRMNVEAFAGAARELRARLRGDLRVTAEEAYEPPSRDFRALLDRVASTHPASVMVYGLGPEVPTLMEQLRATAGLSDVPVTLGYTTTSPPALTRGPVLYGTSVFTVFPVGRDTPALLGAFRGKTTRSGAALSDFVDYAYAYDNVSLLGAALRRSPRGANLAADLAAVMTFDGITGRHAMREREVHFPMRLARFEGDRVVVLSEGR